MQDEPPKPITRLANLADPRGPAGRPRGANRMGQRACVMAMISWAAGALVLAWAAGPPSGYLWSLVVALAFVAISWGAAGFGVVRGIVGLVHAADRHLGRAEAVVAIVLGTPPFVWWTWVVLAYALSWLGLVH